MPRNPHPANANQAQPYNRRRTDRGYVGPRDPGRDTPVDAWSAAHARWGRDNGALDDSWEEWAERRRTPAHDYEDDVPHEMPFSD